MLEHSNESTVLEHDFENIDWKKWREFKKTEGAVYGMMDFLNEQFVEAIEWYEDMFGKKFPFFDRNKKIKDYSTEERYAMDEPVNLWSERVNPATKLKGSEDFARRHMMRRTDLPLQTIEDNYKVWEGKEERGESSTLK